jgi:hypothetical protein
VKSDAEGTRDLEMMVRTRVTDRDRSRTEPGTADAEKETATLGRGWLSTARLIARNPEALNQAMIDFNRDVYAKGSADVRESRIATMETIAADVGMMLFPLQEESLVPVLAVLKAAALPREQDSIEDAPVHLFGAVGVGFWWLLREIEASALVTKQAAVLLDEIMGDQVARITLGVTKTDTVGKGVFRRHACGCAAHERARWKIQFLALWGTSVVDLYVEETHAEAAATHSLDSLVETGGCGLQVRDIQCAVAEFLQASCTSGMAVVCGVKAAVTELSKPVSGLDATFNAPTTPRTVVTCGACDSVGKHFRCLLCTGRFCDWHLRPMDHQCPALRHCSGQSLDVVLDDTPNVVEISDSDHRPLMALDDHSGGERAGQSNVCGRQCVPRRAVCQSICLQTRGHAGLDVCPSCQRFEDDDDDDLEVDLELLGEWQSTLGVIEATEADVHHADWSRFCGWRFAAAKNSVHNYVRGAEQPKQDKDRGVNCHNAFVVLGEGVVLQIRGVTTTTT